MNLPVKFLPSFAVHIELCNFLIPPSYMYIHIGDL